jgi:riboflavin synthase
MFTGLIEAVGQIQRVTPTDRGARLEVSAPFAGELAQGESVAVNGVCLTHVGGDGDGLIAELSPETLRATTLGDLSTGAVVNLERAMRADARLGGHFVLGHVDTTTTITEWRPEGDHWWLELAVPSAIDTWVVEKGSIAVDGISLTIARLRQGSGGQAQRQGSGGEGQSWTIGIQIVPHTRAHTNLAHRRAGERVNIEADIIGKYAARLADLARAR